MYVNLIKKFIKSGIAELANASVIFVLQTRAEIWALKISFSYFVCVTFEFKSVGC
jgi:hypothetical protein